MKFCTKCGCQLDDAAVFCGACGAQMAAPEAAPEAEAPVCEAPACDAPAEKGNKVTCLFKFIGDILALFTAFFYACSMACASLDVNVYLSKYTSSGIGASAYLEMGSGAAVFGFLLSLGVIATGVLNLIGTIKAHKGTCGLFKAIKKLTVGGLLFILGIVLMANM